MTEQRRREVTRTIKEKARLARHVRFDALMADPDTDGSGHPFDEPHVQYTVADRTELTP